MEDSTRVFSFFMYYLSNLAKAFHHQLGNVPFYSIENDTLFENYYYATGKGRGEGKKGGL